MMRRHPGAQGRSFLLSVAEILTGKAWFLFIGFSPSIIALRMGRIQWLLRHFNSACCTNVIQ